jgi:hypothetical protein
MNPLEKNRLMKLLHNLVFHGICLASGLKNFVLAALQMIRKLSEAEQQEYINYCYNHQQILSTLLSGEHNIFSMASLRGTNDTS